MNESVRGDFNPFYDIWFASTRRTMESENWIGTFLLRKRNWHGDIERHKWQLKAHKNNSNKADFESNP